MATITVTVGAYTAAMEVPTDDQLNAANIADLMLGIARDAFQVIALDPTIGESERTDQLAAISGLMLKFVELRAENTPALQLTTP